MLLLVWAQRRVLSGCESQSPSTLNWSTLEPVGLRGFFFFSFSLSTPCLRGDVVSVSALTGAISRPGFYHRVIPFNRRDRNAATQLHWGASPQSQTVRHGARQDLVVIRSEASLSVPQRRLVRPRIGYEISKLCFKREPKRC